MPQQSRRRDPYPWTWEIPLGVVLVILMVLVCGVHLGSEPTEILREHPHAAPYWHGLWQGALHGDDRTAGNRITTVQQALPHALLCYGFGTVLIAVAINLVTNLGQS